MFQPQQGEILTFNKPYKWTSFDVVSKVRAKVRNRIKVKKLKVGHAGTLDPLATGVLIICLGKATKRIEELQKHTKEYVATVRLGATTPSFDLETEEDATFPTEHTTEELIRKVLLQFTGDILQTPPIFSAVKVQGKRAYELARTGQEVELKSKHVFIDEIELMQCDLENKQIVIRVVCSKGTYIRSLARDIGIALNSGAYLTDLCRTRIGEYKLADCLDIETFDTWLDGQDIRIMNEQSATTDK